MGDCRGRIQEAIDLLGLKLRCRAVSPLYRTAPMYVENQPPFLNGVLAAETDLGPLEVLRLLKETEQRVGRLPRERFGPREIDLDLLTYGCARYVFTDDAPGDGDGAGKRDLVLPHPRTAERRFVLQPLFDVAPDLVLPGLGDVKCLLDATSDQSDSVMLVTDAVLSLPSER